MESQVAAGLRSRSRSKTPYLRASSDRDGGAEPEHNRRRTPKRSTPMKQLPPVEEAAQRTRAAAATLLKTSDYSSEESPDRVRTAEQLQNKLNSHYEYTRVTTTTRRTDAAHAGSVADHILSPIQSPIQHSSPFSASYVYGAGRAYNASGRRSYSPAHSACSTDSSFAEQALADVSKVTERDRTQEHLPYKLYKMAGEYWNKYPKTDYTYSPMSRDRVELAPGQVAVPNMSRRSLSQFRLHGASTTDEELRQLLAQHESAWGGGLRKRYALDDSSEDEMRRANGGGYTPIRRRWLLTRWLIAAYTAVTTTVTTTVGSVAEKVRGKERSYAYAHQPQRKQEIGVARRAAATLAAPLLWVYRAFQQVVTTTTTETTTWNDVGAGGAAAAARARAGSGKRRLWPWLLLLLLPLVGYGCYTNPEVFSTIVRETKASPVETNISPTILRDPDLARRIAALESWIGGVDSRFERLDRKLSKIDNIEAQIESHSLKHLQQNLVQTFNMNGRDGKVTSDELKGWFDERYVSKEQMSRDIHERLATQTKPAMDEEAIRRLIEEYRTKFEGERSAVLRETVQRYVREGGCGECAGGGGGGMDEAAVRRVVAAMLDVYDADKTGVVDYALESAGGQVVSTKCTELYQIKTKQYSVLGIPVWWVYTSPRYALTPGAMPAECWAFQGFPGYLVVRTYAVIEVTGFSVEHMSRLLAADGKIESAPKNFSVYGLREELDPEPYLFGTYTYDASGPAIQRFPVQRPSTVDVGGARYPLAYDLVELRVESNHGNPTYTCVYRFRVHGNPLSDVRRAAEDSMRDADV